jgi:hypothetical protein
MSSTYTTRAALAMPGAGDTAWNTTLNADLAQLDAVQAVGALAVAATEQPSASLNVRVAGGTFISSTGGYVSYAGTASQAVTASTTTLLWLTDAGVLTSGTAWPSPGTKHVRLASIVAGATTITSISDARVPFVSAG